MKYFHDPVGSVWHKAWLYLCLAERSPTRGVVVSRLMEVAQDRSDCVLEQLEQSHTSTIGHSVVRLEVGLEVGLVEQQVEMSASQELTERVIISDRHTCPL